LIAVLCFLLSGIGLARFLDREARGGLLLAEGLLAGGGVTAAILALESAVGIRWSIPALLVPVAALSIWSAAAKPSLWFREWRTPLSCLPVLLWHTVYATRADLYDWSEWLITRRDFFFIWGYKARLFFLSQGIAWSFLGNLPNDFTHPDYPLLVPLQFAVPSILAGSWTPRDIGLIDTALAAAALTIAHVCLRDELPPHWASLGTLALTGAVFLPWPGFADGPLVAYASSGALLLRKGRNGMAAPLLALAAMTKNEGIAFVAATAIALAISDRQRLRVLVAPAAVIAGWMLLRWHMHTDLFTPGVLARVAHNVALFPRAFSNIAAYQSFLWIGALTGIALMPLENIRRERFLLTIAALQLACYLGAYAVTPLDVVGHVNGSWDRISSHVTMLLAFAGVTSIAAALHR
jgi:hypothetical protein